MLCESAAVLRSLRYICCSVYDDRQHSMMQLHVSINAQHKRQIDDKEIGNAEIFSY